MKLQPIVEGYGEVVAVPVLLRRLIEESGAFDLEAWFLASIESLRGKRGIRENATSHPEPERPGGAKGHLQRLMKAGAVYGETRDQAPLTSAFDMGAAHRRCRSFRKLVKAFGELVEATGASLPAWPPPAWL
jgi:hypothetical protein